MIRRCAIIGLGLIGGSLGLALNERKLAGHICGMDTNNLNLEMALTGGAVHETTTDLEYAVKNADLVFLSIPVGAIPDILKKISGCLKPGAVVTDVGSTKKMIVERAHAILGAENPFVGGHPMAGAETSGFNGADPHLFENAFYLLTPARRTCPEALSTVHRLVRGMGAMVMEISPEEHELITAAVSHLPHLVAAALVGAVTKMPVGDRALALSAGGFRDTTRVAAGSPEMWRDIFITNRDRVLQSLSFFRSALDDLESAMTSGDREKIYNILDDASRVRRELPIKSRGYLPCVYEVVVTVPDRPGIIAMLAGMLGKAGINISEIEILRAREGYGGTIRIGFATRDEQEQAYNLLRAENIACRRKA
ncbi:MAG: prephenate dehydrogenase [Firmicutes bacterium]|nr:prephenate dehydrogenase [Bacillota bacterium]